MAMTVTTVVIIALAVIAAVVAFSLGAFDGIGIQLMKHMFPATYPGKGDMVDVYINGQWNRTATVTACCHEYLVLFDAIRCPIDYRGAFYAIGKDADGNVITYVDSATHWHQVKYAERLRKVLGLPDEFGTFTPVDDKRPTEEVFSGIKEAVQDENEESEVIDESI